MSSEAYQDFAGKKGRRARKKTFFILCSVLLFVVMDYAQRGKTEIIGKFPWYTEQNSFEEILQIAQKANKPILAVFSATWCSPCQELKTSLLKTDEFKKIADEVVLLYIEQTTKEGAAYNSKYEVIGFPSFRIFSAHGILLDKGFPERTVDGFLKWISDVNAGNNFYELSRKLEKNPNDRETLMKLADKMDGREGGVLLDYLQRAIKSHPDFNDAISQKAYEKLAYCIQGSIRFKEGKEKEEYMADQQGMFQEIISAYYPDKFKYEFKGNFGLNYILNWFYQSQQFDKVLFYFDDFLKRKGDSLDFKQDISVFAIAVPNFISVGKFNEAERWIARICDFSKQNENLSSDQRFIHFHSEIFNEVIKNYEKKGQIARAEKSAGILTEEMLRLKQWMQAVLSITSQAKILEKMGKKEEAKKILTALYYNDTLFKNLNELSVPYTLNLIAWTMVELKIVDQTSLEIAEKVMALNPSAASRNTLACVHAELGNFKYAVKIEKEALAEEKDELSRQEYANRIRAWQAKIE